MIANPRLARAAGGVSAVVRGAARRVESGVAELRPYMARTRLVAALISPFGWFTVASGVVAWIFAVSLGWVELRMLATCCIFLVLVCIAMTFGRANLEVHVDVDPRRLVVGGTTAGRVRVKNIARTRTLPLTLELPIGDSGARFNLPSLAVGGSQEELFVIPTSRRGVITVGPATTLRGDPLGLVRRAVRWTDVIEVFVHPRTVPLEPIGSGLLRDLEGQTTNDISMSDLAFHGLREYATGDDRRFIHWRSSAKLSSAAGAGVFLVKQFLDTRRSHVTVVVDAMRDAYGDDDDFETAISAAASIVMRVMRDDMSATVLAATSVANETSAQLTMDAFSRAGFGQRDLADLAAEGARMAPTTSLAVLLTGAGTTFGTLLRAAASFPSEVKTVVLRIDPHNPPGVTGIEGRTILTLPTLRDLPAMLAGVVQ